MNNTPKPIVLPHPNTYIQATFSADSCLLATKGEQLLTWNADTGQRQVQIEEPFLDNFTFSPIEPTLATTHRGYVCLWDAYTGKRKQTLLHDIFDGGALGYCGLAFDAQGERLAVSQRLVRSDGGVGVVVDLASEQPLIVLRKDDEAEEFRYEDGSIGSDHLREVFSVQFLPGDQRLAGVSYVYDEWDRVYIWDLRTGAKLATFIGNPPEVTKEEYVENLEVSRDGKWLATASTQANLWEMGEENGLCVWHLQHQCGGHQSLLRKLTFSPDSRTLITVDDVLDPATSDTYVMRLWDVASGRIKAQIELYTPIPILEKYFCYAFSPDSRILATVSVEWQNHLFGSPLETLLCLWDVSSGRQIVRWRTETRTSNGGFCGPRQMCFSPDGRKIAVCYFDAVELWEIAVAPALEY